MLGSSLCTEVQMSLEHAPGRRQKGRPQKGRPQPGHAPPPPSQPRPVRTPSPERPVMPRPAYSRASDAPSALGLSVRRVYELVAENRLEVKKIGRAARITSASLLKLIADSTPEAK